MVETSGWREDNKLSKNHFELWTVINFNTFVNKKGNKNKENRQLRDIDLQSNY